MFKLALSKLIKVHLVKHPRIDSCTVLLKYSKSFPECTEHSRACDSSCGAGNYGGENIDATCVKSSYPMHANGQAAQALPLGNMDDKC